MDKQLFDDAIGEVPPSTVDVGTVITRGRRAARVRRLAAPAVAAGVAVVLVSGAIAASTTRDGDGGVDVGGSSAASQPLTSKPVAACSQPVLEPAPEVSARLTGVVTPLVHAQRPDLVFEANQLTEQHEPFEVFQAGHREGAPARSICDQDSYFVAAATTREPAGEGYVLLVVRPDFYDHLGSADCSAPGFEQPFCQKVSGPNGATIVMRTVTTPVGRTEHRVDIDRPDGTQVMISAANILTSADGNDVVMKIEPIGAKAVAPVPPLTLDQLVAIGTAPALTLFP